MLYNTDWNKKNNPVADLMNRAADLIDQNGYSRHNFLTTQFNAHLHGAQTLGSMCILGALQIAAGVTSDNLCRTRFVQYETLSSAFFKLKDHLEMDPAIWNNEIAGSTEAVSSKLREVAALVDA